MEKKVADLKEIELINTNNFKASVVLYHLESPGFRKFVLYTIESPWSTSST